ncbi:MAG: hypothetical protein DI531_08180 [Brevundimonas sp.]|uniref:hypothetical protein n=1 Tax=Brevundimonas sp. TaxID=1871086 RepID=UPI000DB55BF8|nr:hypothetical protein [Brevundimonas sp.]PZU74140.1 MAG: hypothetical protein DI531_08180 [Brevundimonas sp.]
MTDPQDPLPEGQWLFRRIFTWTLTVALLGLLGWITWRMPADALQPVALWLIGLIALVVTYYLLAPSAAELARIFAELRVRLPFNRTSGESS